MLITIFFSCVFTVRRYASVVYVVVVCLSVRLSVTIRYYTKMAKRRIMETVPCDIPGTLAYY